MFVIGIAGYRLPYNIALSILFLATGAVIGQFASVRFTYAILTITAASSAIMFLQVTGAGEWTQALTTHGYISETVSVPKEPRPTLFLKYHEVQANYLQGRPAGLLHSNQFACLIVLFAFAICMRSGRTNGLPVAVMLSAAAVLTLAKVVFLGVAMLTAFNFIWGDRQASIRFGVTMAICTGVYALLFPGMFQIFFFSCHNIWQSIAVRYAEFSSSVLGLDDAQLYEYLEEMNICPSDQGILRPDIISDITAMAVSSEPMSAVSAFEANPAMIYSLIFSISLIFIANKKASTSATVWFRENFTTRHVAVAIAVATFSLAANFLDAPIFWLLAGFSIPGQIFTGEGASRSLRVEHAA